MPDQPSPFGGRSTLDRRRFLTGLVGAGASGALLGCTSRVSSGSGATGPVATGPGTTGPVTTRVTTSTTTTTRSDPVPGAATVDRPARRIAPPGPPGAYDREALYVALYGFPGSSILGSLGEQDVAATVRRLREAAAPYERFGRRVVPTFEILASVASAFAGVDGDYSNEFDPSRFEPYLDAATAEHLHVVFDLQTGRSSFPDQAREYEALWRIPNTSIALDPEWRVGPTEQPGGGFIGTVDADEVNATIDYVDGLVRRYGLPPKMCIVHQFSPTMITDKERIRGTDHVQVLIQMDGFGTLDRKRGTWARTVADLPAGAFAGWKNFYDEDRPTPTPAETMANEPTPRYVSYQ